MKRNSFLLAVVLALLVPLGGCDRKLTFDEAKALAKIGGMASAETWVIVAKPTPDQITAVSGALDVTIEALKNYSGSGDFADALPQIYEGIDKLKIPEDLKPMADSLAEAAVLGLDFWFSQNPDWKNKGVQSAQLATIFVQSAKDELPKSVNNKVFKNSRLIKARGLKK